MAVPNCDVFYSPEVFASIALLFMRRHPVLVTLLKGYFQIDRLQPSSRPNLRARNALQDEMTESEHPRRSPSETVNIGVRLCFSVRKAVPLDLGLLALHWLVCYKCEHVE
jgi:hypothetical protein